jgi:uncharacterized protein (DUF302 family)
MAAVVQNGIVTVRSHYSVPDTVERFETVLKEHGLKLFCRVNHSQEAAEVGMTMRPTVLLIFGNPKTGTPLMLNAPSIALDLPLKVLIWGEPTGETWIAYNAPEYLRDRHHLSGYLMRNIEAVQALCQQAAGTAQAA